jgi:AcrR family transcriptional regulator
MLLLKAARELFGERGYDGTTTRAIAERACASEVLVYRYFGSKAALFDEAVAAPFENLIAELREGWRDRRGALDQDMPEYSRGVTRSIYRLLRGDRALISALVAGRSNPRDVKATEGRPGGLKRFFDEAAATLAAHYAANEPDPGFPPELGARLAFATVFAAALLEDWLFTDCGDQERIEEAIVNFENRALYR